MKRIFCLIFLMFGLVMAGEGDDPLAALRKLAGDWQLTFLQIDEAGVFQNVGTSHSTFTVKLDGKLVQEETTVKTVRSEFPVLVCYTYDPTRKVYRKSSTDAVSGNMDILEGQMADGVLTVDNTKYQTWFVNKSGTELAFRIAFDVSRPEQPIMIADLSTDHGLTWHQFQHIIYKRQPRRSASNP